VYSPELTALLTSTHSRTTKALRKGSLISPPILPPRAGCFSEEARLLGPFSKRREVNLRWRYFRQEWKKVLPPLQLSVKEISSSFEVTSQSSDTHNTAGAGVRGVGLQGGGILEEAQNLAGPAWKPLSTPRRARKGPVSETLDPSDESPFTTSLSTRWLRKRYQDLLGRVPVLTYSFKQRKDDEDNRGSAGQYEVTLAPSAMSSRIRYGANRLPLMDESNLLWIQLAEEIEERKTEPIKQKQKRDRITTQNADGSK